MSVRKYKKKPVVIEAVKVDDAEAVATWINDNGGRARTGEHTEQIHGRNVYPFDGHLSVWIDTLEGTMRADPGMFVIRGVQGEFYGCAADIFAATYESAEDAA